MANLRLAVFGAGFWPQYQLAAWREIAGVELVAIYNRTRAKAEALARRFGVPAVYDDPAELIERERPDLVDVITHPDGHPWLVHLAIQHRVPVVCQKPIAPTLMAAERMVRAAIEAGVFFAIHENWRWQTPIRQLKATLDSGVVGKPFRAHVLYANSFPYWLTEPALLREERFVVATLGVHILDTVRYLFGEPAYVFCQTDRVKHDIAGEDVATLMIGFGDLTCVVELSYASRLEHERFPETYVLVEAERGSVELGPDCWIRVTTEKGTRSRRYPPPHYHWADPAYELVHSSIVPCNADILRALREGVPAETDARDNIKSARLTFAAYDSAEQGQVVGLWGGHRDRLHEEKWPRQH